MWNKPVQSLNTSVSPTSAGPNWRGGNDAAFTAATFFKQQLVGNCCNPTDATATQQFVHLWKHTVTEPCTTKQVQYIPSFILLLENLKPGYNFPSLVNPGFLCTITWKGWCCPNMARKQPAEQLISQRHPSASYVASFLSYRFTNLGPSTRQGDHSPHQSITAELKRKIKIC